MHQALTGRTWDLYSSGHYDDAALLAIKLVQQRLAQRAGLRGDGYPLLKQVFEPPARLDFARLPKLAAPAKGAGETAGIRKLIAGLWDVYRNPLTHQDGDAEAGLLGEAEAFEVLMFATLLLRRIDAARLCSDT